MKVDLRKLALGIAAPLLALVVALALTSLILWLAGDPVLKVWGVLFKAPLPRQLVSITNEAVVLYLSAVAVAISFKWGCSILASTVSTGSLPSLVRSSLGHTSSPAG